MKARFIIFRVIGVLLVLGLLFGGGFAAYRFGYNQGVAQSPAIADALAQGLKNGSAVPFHRGFDGPMMPGYGYGFAPMRGPHFGFFPFGGILGFLFMAFLFFGLLRLIFRPHWGWHRPWMHQGGPQQPGQSAPQAPAAQQSESPQSEKK
jgi:hypothetical protein